MPRPRYDGHHILFEARNWAAHQPNRTLRQKPGLIVDLDRDAHEELHREVATVVAPSHRMGMAVLSLYRDNPDDNIRSMENLMFAIDRATKHPRVRPIERQIGGLIIASVEAQLPFIRGNILTYGPEYDTLF